MTWETNQHGEQQGVFAFFNEGGFYCPERVGSGQNYYSNKFDFWNIDQKSKLRTCSFCGSLHADDAIELITDDGKLERTTKGYKYYVHHARRVGANKLYTWHVDKEQQTKLHFLTVLR